MFHHCHPVPGLPRPWQITHQQPYSNSSVSSWAAAAAAAGMEALVSTQSHVPNRVPHFNHTNIQGSLIEQQVQCETGTKNELLHSKSNTQTDQLKLPKSSTERSKQKSMASPTKMKHAPNDVKSNRDNCTTTSVPKPHSYNNMSSTLHNHLSNVDNGSTAHASEQKTLRESSLPILRCTQIRQRKKLS